MRVRARRWRVESVDKGERAVAVDLVAAERETAGQRNTLLAPFDDFERVGPGATHHVIREGAAIGTLATMIASATAWPTPDVARSARIELLPHQLSACLALRTSTSRLVLLADPVGSGKTIQAGLALADLLHRRPGARALVLVPAGLRGQWRAEMRTRFSLDLHDLHGDTWREEDNSIDAPPPWQQPGIVLASLDYVKRPEVLACLDGIWWDLAVVDEAHHAAAGTDRGAAVRALCRRSLAVLLLTATPHDGDDTRFLSLCDLGRLHRDEPFLLLRRTPDSLPGHRPRRSHFLEVTVSDEERHARQVLSAYLRAMREASSRQPGGESQVAGLLAAVFTKRAASSPAALERTSRRRLELAGARPLESQPVLPFANSDPLSRAEEDDTEGESVLSLKGPLAWNRERAWLGTLVEAARRASRASPKLNALRRLLSRVREPAIVFTEYRDTLDWLVRGLPRSLGPSCLHGLQTAQEREAQLSSFLSGRVRLLLATDVGAEGLNLQHRCRLVIEFDRPWTPLRSEQRVGRVDRMGQTRQVHAWSLVTRDEVDARLEEAVAARRSAAMTGVVRHPGLSDRVGRMEHESHRELTTARGLVSRLPERAVEAAERRLCAEAPLVVFASARRRRAFGLHGRDVVVLFDNAVTADGRVVDATVIALAAEGGALSWDLPRVLVRAREAASRAFAPHLTRLEGELRGVQALDASRARLVEAALREDVAAHFVQPDLFGEGPRRVRVDQPPRGTLARELLPLSLVTRTVLVIAPRSWRATQLQPGGLDTEAGR